MAEIPHFSVPFRFELQRSGQMVIPVTEQDTVDEIADCVEMTLRYEQGERRTLPGFGRPQMLAFTTERELARAQIQTVVDEAEPRVRSIIERDGLDLEESGLLRILAMYELAVDEEAEEAD
ncbi:MAG: hypothetical protein L3J91_01005 [Thermoplasmata archaeon]|nr:hypothetical protein [Thermoplasmata archaeon]